MIIKTDKNIAGLAKIDYKGDNFIFTHAELITPIMEKAHILREFGNNGWTTDKGYRQIGTIPAIEFVRHPEWANNTEEILKWLRSGEGEAFRTVKGGI